ncbi:hypothetical protein IAU60_000727 [Kwoniella sp. DSM 27419]
MSSNNTTSAQEQLDLLQLLVSMYLPEELRLSDTTQALYDAYVGGECDTSGLAQAEALDAELSLPLDEYDREAAEEVVFQLHLPLSAASSSSQPVQTVVLRPRQPSWLPRSGYESLLEGIPRMMDGTEASEYLLTTVDSVRESLKDLRQAVKEAQEVQQEATSRSNSQPQAVDYASYEGPIDRVWFWFPTLSTKEKRADIVNFANEWKLTGFVLAGKPALLCVEGPGQLVEKYMSRIKSESWSDIPPHHKKVSERFRRPLGSPSDRAFTSMTEITHLIPKYGQYNHRGDMSEVKRLMEEWGVGDDFGAVVMPNVTS